MITREGWSDDEVAVTTDRPVAPAHSLVMPYRSGYEENDREAIQERLSSGELAGVISTSALELGLDLPGINTVVLVGVPQSSTSLRQRIGRVGRRGPGRVIVIDSGGIGDSVAFRQPERLLDRAPAQSSLYLENRRIQYIHALCFAAPGGEYDMLIGAQPEAGSEPAERMR